MDSYIQKPNDYGAALRTTALATVGSHCPTSISLPELALITLTFFWVKEVFLIPPRRPPPPARSIPSTSGNYSSPRLLAYCNMGSSSTFLQAECSVITLFIHLTFWAMTTPDLF